MRVLKGQAISQSGSAVRKARVSENRANWIHNNFNWAGCSSYPTIGSVPFGLAVTGCCNYLDYATLVNGIYFPLSVKILDYGM